MKKVFLILMSFVILGVNLYATEWEVDRSHSGIYFTVRHLGISNVKGEFVNYEVKVIGENENVEKAEVTAKIYVDSIKYKGTEERFEIARLYRFGEIPSDRIQVEECKKDLPQQIENEGRTNYA